MATPSPPPESPHSARYTLAVLVAVYALNFLDRQILAILAERIKADLAVSDAQLGYLYGTVFAVFYAIFAIPLGRLADVWDRRRLIAWGLVTWSAMTALSGLARSFPQLALARIGVGRPSAEPRRGSRSERTQAARSRPGRPTTRNATCQPWSPSGAPPAAKAASQRATTTPPITNPRPAPR
jgi:hypothetical protein